jgi:hypothetical protein
MKIAQGIFICLFIIAILATGYLAPGIATIIALTGLLVWCYRYGRLHGWGPAFLKFLKEILFGW